MTTLFSHAPSSSNIVTEVSETASSTVTTQIDTKVQRQIDRLVASLIARDAAPGCILMMEVGEEKDSSLWLANAVAAVMGTRVKQNVHVLSIESEKAARAAAKQYSLRFPGSRNFTLEKVENLYTEREGAGTLTERIATLRAANQTVILYLAQDQSLADLLPSASQIDGVVLLVRASKARRAALLAIEDRLAAAQMKLFGCVLLDRTYPIPNSLYKLL